MDLRDALVQITEIRQRLAETEVFRGYRSLPIAFSGLLATAAALMQPFLISDPIRDVGLYCALWFGVAGLSIAAAGLTMFLRDHLSGVSQTRELTLLALSQFAPSLIAGGLVTLIVVKRIPESGPMLPGLWQVLFSLGLFASCRLLPKASVAVALFYGGCGSKRRCWTKSFDDDSDHRVGSQAIR
jgi:hypothetical protein